MSYPVIVLSPEERAWATTVGIARNMTHPIADASDSGMSDDRTHMVGAIAEVAVCRYYGVDYQDQVEVYDRPRGPSPDVICAGYTFSVKGRERWQLPLDLVVHEHDTQNDIYLLVSVDFDQARCGLRGWITRQELLRYPAEAWKWDNGRPGATRNHLRRRYIPVQDLRPCRNTRVSTIQAPRATIEAARP